MRYNSVALTVTVSSIGVVLLLVSIGYVHALTLVSIPLLALGSWTLAYGVYSRNSYHGVWGSMLTGLGLALLSEQVTGNLLLNFAILIIALSVGGLLLARKG